jgi:hypothetical protein
VSDGDFGDVMNRVLRKIYGPKGPEVIGGRKLYEEELHNFTFHKML